VRDKSGSLPDDKIITVCDKNGNYLTSIDNKGMSDTWVDLDNMTRFDRIIQIRNSQGDVFNVDNLGNIFGSKADFSDVENSIINGPVISVSVGNRYLVASISNSGKYTGSRVALSPSEYVWQENAICINNADANPRFMVNYDGSVVINLDSGTMVPGDKMLSFVNQGSYTSYIDNLGRARFSVTELYDQPDSVDGDKVFVLKDKLGSELISMTNQGVLNCASIHSTVSSVLNTYSRTIYQGPLAWNGMNTLVIEDGIDVPTNSKYLVEYSFHIPVLRNNNTFTILFQYGLNYGNYVSFSESTYHTDNIGGTYFLSGFFSFYTTNTQSNNNQYRWINTPESDMGTDWIFNNGGWFSRTFIQTGPN
jgi:hypothetical protein